ncbi:MAG: Spermine synthase [Patescibacteria group bacterium]|nr:Spermine synthase [Patescibacteria group bacterium]
MEIVATRVLSPFYGNTIFTVSSVISVILAALSVGYYIGGRFADRHATMRWFFSIILLSGLILLLFHIVGTFALPMLGYALSISVGPLVSSLLIFFPPAFLLGTLSPYAVKLQSVNFPEQGVGTVAGKIFFWSTLGSIVGSLSAGFVLIPFFGVNQIIIANGVVLFFLGLIPLFILGEKKYLIKSLLVISVMIGILLYISNTSRKNVLYSKDGVYEKITIYDGQFDGRPTRFFQQDRSNSGAMFLDSDNPKDLAYGYTKYYSLYKVFNPDIKNALVIGGGAYSIPKALLADLPDAIIDVSEIEPSLYNLAKKYFGVDDNPRLNNYTDDGRRLLHDSNKNYDLIFSDVYYSLFSIPAHFTTQEFFEISKKKLNQDGVFVANMIGDLSRQQPSLIMSEIKTFQKVFPNSYLFAVESPSKTKSQNIIFVGYNSDKLIDLNAPSIIMDTDPVIRSLKDKVIDIDRFDLSPYPIMTDDYSPVEYLTGQVLQRSFNQNNDFDGEDMLAVIDQQLRYGPRYPTATGHKQVQDFLIAEMTELTHEVKTQTWQHTESGGNSYELTNIIARLHPTQTKRIILATHYDSQKISFKNSSNQNLPSPGANNSASGVAVLVELARHFGSSPILPSVGIDIVFFDGEEGEESQGGDFTNWKPLGSTYFIEHLNEIYGDKKPVTGVVLDMVCEKDLKIFKEASSVKNAPSQTESFWDIAGKINGDIFQNEIRPEIRDDHTSLNQAGIPSFLVIDYDYPQYATTNDTIEKCSAESLQTVAETVWKYTYYGIH